MSIPIYAKSAARVLLILAVLPLRIQANSLKEPGLNEVGAILPFAEADNIAPPKGILLLGDGSLGEPENRKKEIGAKGFYLWAMALLGMPVPAGFSITSDICRYYHENDVFPSGIMEEIKDAVGEVEKRMIENFNIDRKYGDRNNPLLLSARSGAYVTSPGKYRTMINIGLHPNNVLGYAKQIRSEENAYKDLVEHMKDFAYYALRNDELYWDILYAIEKASRDKNIEDVVADINQCYVTHTSFGGFPEPFEQIPYAVAAVINSYIEADFKFIQGDAVTVQAMVYGNIDDGLSAAGAVTSRNPENGKPGLSGSVKFNAGGREVVTPNPDAPVNIESLKELARRAPDAYKLLEEIAKKLEDHYNAPRYFEIVVEGGRLFMVQDRSGEHMITPLALVRILTDMLREAELSNNKPREEILRQKLEELTLSDLVWVKTYLESPVITKKAEKKSIALGIPIVPGIAFGKAVIGDKREYGENSVIFTKMPYTQGAEYTSFEEYAGYGLIKGIVASIGSRDDHAAAAIRGLMHPIPYVCGVDMRFSDDNGLSYINESSLLRRMKNLCVVFETETGKKIIIKDGDSVTIDGNTGRVYPGKLTESDYEPSEITRVLNGSLSAELSSLYPVYQKILELLDKKRAQSWERMAAEPPANAAVPEPAARPKKPKLLQMFRLPGKSN